MWRRPIRRVCRGNWADNAHPLLVFSDDRQETPDTDTICIPCRDAMLAKLYADKEAADARHLLTG